MDMAAKYMEDIEELTVQVQQQDNWIWEGDPSGSYTVGNAYMLLNQNMMDENHDEVFTALWKLKIPSITFCLEVDSGQIANKG